MSPTSMVETGKERYQFALRRRESGAAATAHLAADAWILTSEICKRLDRLIALIEGPADAEPASPIERLRRGERPIATED